MMPMPSSASLGRNHKRRGKFSWAGTVGLQDFNARHSGSQALYELACSWPRSQGGLFSTAQRRGVDPVPPPLGHVCAAPPAAPLAPSGNRPAGDQRPRMTFVPHLSTSAGDCGQDPTTTSGKTYEKLIPSSCL